MGTEEKSMEQAAKRLEQRKTDTTPQPEAVRAGEARVKLAERSAT